MGLMVNVITPVAINTMNVKEMMVHFLFRITFQ
jgi:hypothetical protein